MVVFGVLALLLVLGGVTSAQQPWDFTNPVPEVSTVDNVMTIISTIVSWIYILFFILAVAFILLAAFNYLTAAGDAEKVKTAHNMVIYAVVAIVVALLAVGVRVIITNFLHGSNPGGTI